MRAKAVVEGGGDGDGVSFAIHDGVVRGVGRFVTRRPAVVGAGGRKPSGRTRSALGLALSGRMLVAPGVGIFFRGEFGDGNVVVVGIAEVVGAIHVGAAIGFGDEVDPCGGAVAEAGEVVAFEDIERAQRAPLRRRRAAAR